MKFWTIIGLLPAVGGAFAQAVRTNNNQGDGAEKSYNFDYSRKDETTIVGTVTGKIKGSPLNGTAESMSILVKNKKTGKVYSVDLGPAWYVGDQATKIRIGDKIKIFGEPVTMANSKADVEKFMIARLVQKGHNILALRDSSGYPYWDAYRKGEVAVNSDPTKNSNKIEGKIMSTNPVTAENQQEAGYQIQTSNGMYNVAVAPMWYAAQQNPFLHVGDYVTVYSGFGPSPIEGYTPPAGTTIVAQGIYGNGGTLVLRPNGVPVWNGWGSAITGGGFNPNY